MKSLKTILLWFWDRAYLLGPYVYTAVILFVTLTFVERWNTKPIVKPTASNKFSHYRITIESSIYNCTEYKIKLPSYALELPEYNLITTQEWTIQKVYK